MIFHTLLVHQKGMEEYIVEGGAVRWLDRTRELANLVVLEKTKEKIEESY